MDTDALVKKIKDFLNSLSISGLTGGAILIVLFGLLLLAFTFILPVLAIVAAVLLIAAAVFIVYKVIGGK
jgi:hypothetical protein